MGFLSSIFGGKSDGAKKRSADARDIERSFAFEALNPDLAAHIAEKIAANGDVVFSDRDKNMNDAALAFRNVRDHISGRPLNSLKLEYIWSEAAPVVGNVNICAKDLTVDNCKLPASDWASLQKSVKNNGIKSLLLYDITKEQGKPYPPLQNLDAYAGLESLSIIDCALRDEDLTRLADGLVKKSALKKLDLSDNYARDQGLVDVINALPDSLEELNLCKIPLGNVLGVLADKVEKMPNLKALDLADCDITGKDLDVLMPKLPPSVRILNLRRNRVFDDDALKTLIGHLKRTDCNVYQTNASITFNSLSDTLKQELSEVEALNLEIVRTDRQKQKADAIAKAKGEKTLGERLAEADATNIKTLLYPALQTGMLPEAFDRMQALGSTLTEKDLNAANEKGETFVQSCAKKKQVKTLMRPEMYGNAKDYQAVYNALSDRDKALFDGKDGRPSFMKMKSQVMANAVKKAVAAKSGAQRG